MFIESSKQAADWVAVDWGSTQLRCWAIGEDGVPLARAASDRGSGKLRADGFEPALLELISDWLAKDACTPVIVCGMAGSAQGWHQTGYTPTPCNPISADRLVRVAAADRRICVEIVPGVSQHDPPDVMRGEETQIAGFTAGNTQSEATLCLPGTHSKWAVLRTGMIEHFRTFMTGELFALLSQESILRHSVSQKGWNQEAFEDAVDEALMGPQALSAWLFSLRAGQLLREHDGVLARSRLSGWLIGLELAGSWDLWESDTVHVIGADRIGSLYISALKRSGCNAISHDGEAMTLRGLARVCELRRKTLLRAAQ